MSTRNVRAKSDSNNSVIRFRLGRSGDLRRVPFVPRKKRLLVSFISTELPSTETLSNASSTPLASESSSSSSTPQQSSPCSSNAAIGLSAISDVQQYDVLQKYIHASSDVFCLQKRLDIRQLSSMQDVQEQWIALALQDSAFFHAALSHYIGVDELDERQGDPVRALEHRMKALSVVNERLQSPQIATCNATIAAVASIGAYEASNGCLDIVIAHMKGLEQLVKMRGGFREAGFSEPLKLLVAWADLVAAFALNAVPTILPFDSPHVQDTIPGANFDFLKSHDRVCDVMAMLGPLSKELATGLMTAERHNTYGQGLYTAQRSLSYLLGRRSSTRIDLDHLSCLAAAIYITTCLRAIGSHARIVQDLVARLINAMRLSGTAQSLDSDLEARRLTWALFCGGVAASQPGDCVYFAKKLVSLCTRLKLRSWGDAEVMLHSIAWCNSWGRSHQQFWRQIIQTQS